MAEKQITIEDLAHMVNKGFESAATRQDVEGLHKDMNELRTDMDEDFKEVFRRLNKIEDVLLEGYNNRITQLEKDLKEVRELLKL